MSASFTETQTCMRFRSLAIRNRLGAFRLDDDGLADVDPAVDDDALDRGLDRAVAQVALRPLQGCLGLGNALPDHAASPTATFACAIS